MKLVSILQSDLVMCRIHGKDRRDIYSRMVAKAAEEIDFSQEESAIVDELIERETSLNVPGETLALPHMRVHDLDDLYIVIATLAEPVLMRENDLEPTRVVVMSFISPTTSDVYLKGIAAFSRYFAKKEKVDAFVAATTPQEALELLRKDDVTLKKNITAEDLMTCDVIPLKADMLLSSALDSFYVQKRQVLPIVDGDGCLIGELNAYHVIKRFIPDYIFMLNNLNFLNSFEVFDRIFQEESVQKVEEFMEKPKKTISPDTPLIQFTVSLVRHEAEEIYVVDEKKNLLGVVALNDILHKVLRG